MQQMLLAFQAQSSMVQGLMKTVADLSASIAKPKESKESKELELEDAGWRRSGQELVEAGWRSGQELKDAGWRISGQ